MHEDNSEETASDTMPPAQLKTGLGCCQRWIGKEGIVAKKKDTTGYFHRFDLEELAAHLTGLSEKDDYDSSDIEENLIEQYGIDLEKFYELADKLAALLDMAVSPLTEEPFIGFGTGKIWIAKRPFPTFINQVLVWMSAEQISDGKGRAYERDIHSGGKNEFKLVLMKGDQEYKLINKKEVSNG